jgi:hypothetical protein
MSGLARRRARVELALVREGDGLNVSALARELGVSRWTVDRDIAHLRARWETVERIGGRDLDAERSRTAAVYEAVAAQAWEQYARLAAERPEHRTTVNCLRVIADAYEKRARLLGLEERTPEEAGEQNFVVEFSYPEGARPLTLPPPGGYRKGEGG